MATVLITRRACAALLAAPCILRQGRAADVPRFALGVASGRPRPGGMVLWTRLTGADLPPRVEVHWELAHDERFSRLAARGSTWAQADDAHTVHAEPAGLAPGRGYGYRFFALGDASPAGRTCTAPAADEPVRLKAVLASCQRWEHGHWAAWRDAVAADPDLVLFAGDYIYEYGGAREAVRRIDGGEAGTLAGYRARYAAYKSDPLLQAAHAACPWLVVWDDHEVQNDYAGVVGQDLDPGFAARRAAAYRAWWEHMPVPMALRPGAAGGIRSHLRLDWGRLARLHLLDDRQWRDPQACPRPGRAGSRTLPAGECAALADPRRSLLGAAQEAWLAAGWDRQRPWNLVLQQTLMARCRRSRDDRVWTDGWDGYPAARRRLLAQVADRRLPGVVVLGGDVHAHYACDLKADWDDPRAPVVASEFCGTSISSRGAEQELVDDMLRLNPHLRWGRSDRRGTIRLTIDERTVHADLRAVDDAADPASAVRSAAAFAVAHGRPGPQRA